jgi:hypothetical protein
MIDLLKGFLNSLFEPSIALTWTILLVFAFYRFRRVITQNKVVAGLVIASPVLFFALSALDANFWIQFKRPDNIPIAIMMFLVVFFCWLGLKLAVDNDDRIRDGRPPKEADPEEEEKVFVWPDLVYTEFLCLLLVSIFLVVWSILIPAPLEEPANPQLTPNPSKAPWYFLGLQEILVYFDPWLAGVVIPTFILIGLMVIPYIDTNEKGNGYYTYEERRSEILLFQFGFLVLWIFLVFEGTFLRGPNWNFYGPYEYWDAHKLVPLTNINLSELVWTRGLGIGLPGFWLVREFLGILLVTAYFVALPAWLARSYMRKYYDQMGMMRYVIFTQLLLWMVMIPIKMYLRWTLNLKYFVAIPEFFFNI